jgi:hypothetical protein
MIKMTWSTERKRWKRKLIKLRSRLRRPKVPHLPHPSHPTHLSQSPKHHKTRGPIRMAKSESRYHSRNKSPATSNKMMNTALSMMTLKKNTRLMNTKRTKEKKALIHTGGWTDARLYWAKDRKDRSQSWGLTLSVCSKTYLIWTIGKALGWLATFRQTSKDSFNRPLSLQMSLARFLILTSTTFLISAGASLIPSRLPRQSYSNWKIKWNHQNNFTWAKLAFLLSRQ